MALLDSAFGLSDYREQDRRPVTKIPEPQEIGGCGTDPLDMTKPDQARFHEVLYHAVSAHP